MAHSHIMSGLLFLLCCTELYAKQHKTKPQHRKPNIVFMLVDDLGWSDVSFHGSKQVPTPNIDVIARDGIILNNYYVQPICSPSRATLMTGKHPVQLGMYHDVIKANQPWGLPLDEKILPQYLKELEYDTCAVGKWHLGYFKKDYLPTKRGFDSFFGYYNGVEDYFNHVSIEGDMKGLDLHNNTGNVWCYNGTYGPDLLTDKAKKVIEKHDPNKPLFLYIAQQAPHSGNFNTEPVQAPEKYVKPMVGIDNERRKIFAGMLSAMDHSVGEIFHALEQSGLLDNTIFIFSTDNGGSPQESDGSSGSNWPLKGSKYNLWEGGMKGVSFVWSHILRHRSHISNDLIHISDWLPTILSAAGGADALKMLPKDIMGIDQWPSLAYSKPSRRQEILLNIDGEERIEGIRKGKYKLVIGSYRNSTLDKWYDQEGRVFNVTYSFFTPQQKALYERNYMRFLKDAKAAKVLQKKYGKDPLLAASCHSWDCRELEVKCGGLPPAVSTCDAEERQPCLYDVNTDPCEFKNLAEEMPDMVDKLKQAINKYRPLVVPSGIKPADPEADPKLHGGAWVPWRS